MDWNYGHLSISLYPYVTPYVGVWIETCVMEGLDKIKTSGHTLRGCVDWNFLNLRHFNLHKSHTLRGCVDWNSVKVISKRKIMSHTLRGCVDWNQSYTSCISCSTIVTPYVGVWIETMEASSYTKAIMCHTLRGCVDWNKKDQRENLVVSVTPYVGVWIETLNLLRHSLVY